jgi:hypothetical protein
MRPGRRRALVSSSQPGGIRLIGDRWKCDPSEQAHSIETIESLRKLGYVERCHHQDAYVITDAGRRVMDEGVSA